MRLLPTEIMAGSPIRSRDISLGDDPGINGQLWDVNRIDVTAQQGTWERWTVRADEPQAFHIEGVMFQIRNVNGAMPFPEDRGWKDTVWVDGQVELLVYFGQPSPGALPVLLQQSDAGNGGPWLDWATVSQPGTVIFILARGGRVWNTFRFLFRSGL